MLFPLRSAAATTTTFGTPCTRSMRAMTTVSPAASEAVVMESCAGEASVKPEKSTTTSAIGEADGEEEGTPRGLRCRGDGDVVRKGSAGP